ncbi:host specificity factor TipJ family phage tail protein [Photobacterium atrarenae]|uniref:Host specificity factor TipJ family phage tail protein n=1 Tax=Photobacterium atrarenae TaxID=865757 RepID=A0ABY5GLG4_9GAMM|nr:host specificity factor TipJ family phage tail protein [Photobacterium atrarenae]UTV30154.1 host specificity factor TipJ family phage tail protein [Photobacterium atrarenae]
MSKFSLEPVEVAYCEPGISLHDWFKINVPSYQQEVQHPVSAYLNENHLEPVTWPEVILQPGDCIVLTLEPKDIFTGGWMIYLAIAAAAAAGAYFMSQALPDNYNSSTPEGSSIYDANIQGNRPRLMGIIPEIFGTHKVYFDLLNAQHRYYSNDEEYLLMFCAIGVGWYDLPDSKITIGNSPITNYAGDIDVRKFNPGENVTAHPAYKNVYTSPEVGATAGTGGIELEGPVNSVVPPKTAFNQTTITIYQNLEGFLIPYWPPEWEVGQRIELKDTPGAHYVYGSEAGGWRKEGDADILNYWSKDPALHDCQKGQYVLYPTEVDTSGGVGKWLTGMIDAKFFGVHNGDEYYAVRVVDQNGNQLPADTVNFYGTQAPIKFLGRDDGVYRITSRTDKTGMVQKLYPNKSTTMSWWSSFEAGGNLSGVRLTAINTYPGKIFGPIRVTPSLQKTRKVMVDIRWPTGIGYIKDNGDIESRTLKVMLQWREIGTTNWKSVPISRTGATRDQLGLTVPITLSKECEPEFRCYRVTGKDNESRVLDKIELVRVKCELDSNTSYPGITTIGLRVKGTNALSKSAENKFAGVPTRMLQVPDGNGGWTSGRYPTNDIAPASRYIAKACGFTDQMISQFALLRLHQIWNERGDEFNAVFDNDSTHFEAQRRVLSCGYAYPTLDFGQLIPVRDEPRSGKAYMYMPDNMTSPLSIKVKHKLASDHDSVEVEYFDKRTWKPETILCKLPESPGIKPKKLKPFGITDRAKAWQWGMREARKMRYRRKNYSWGTELDGLNSAFLSRADVGWSVPGYGQNGRVTHIVHRSKYTAIFTNADLTWQEGKEHVIALRRPDGTRFGPVAAQRGPAPGEVRITEALDFTPAFDGYMEPPFFMFGDKDNYRLPALVMNVVPDGTNDIRIEAENYDERVYEDDERQPPAALMVGYG